MKKETLSKKHWQEDSLPLEPPKKPSSTESTGSNEPGMSENLEIFNFYKYTGYLQFLLYRGAMVREIGTLPTLRHTYIVLHRNMCIFSPDSVLRQHFWPDFCELQKFMSKDVDTQFSQNSSDQNQHPEDKENAKKTNPRFFQWNQSKRLQRFSNTHTQVMAIALRWSHKRTVPPMQKT